MIKLFSFILAIATAFTVIHSRAADLSSCLKTSDRIDCIQSYYLISQEFLGNLEQSQSSQAYSCNSSLNLEAATQKMITNWNLILQERELLDLDITFYGLSVGSLESAGQQTLAGLKEELHWISQRKLNCGN